MAKRRNRDWSHELALFENSTRKTRTFKLSSPGVARVTRVRLIKQFDTNVSMHTTGNALVFTK